jgi:hypothetical protein
LETSNKIIIIIKNKNKKVKKKMTQVCEKVLFDVEFDEEEQVVAQKSVVKQVYNSNRISNPRYYEEALTLKKIKDALPSKMVVRLFKMKQEKD